MINKLGFTFNFFALKTSQDKSKHVAIFIYGYVDRCNYQYILTFSEPYVLLIRF